MVSFSTHSICVDHYLDISASDFTGVLTRMKDAKVQTHVILVFAHYKTSIAFFNKIRKTFLSKIRFQFIWATGAVNKISDKALGNFLDGTIATELGVTPLFA